MATVRNCHLPVELFYDVANNVWARRESDGTITVGMTSYACSLVGELVAYLPKKVGSRVEQGKSLASVESGKWVGPIKAPVGGEIIRINEAIAAKPSIINTDPYGLGWAVKLKPSDWDDEAGRLVTGSAVAAAFEAKMAADGFVGR